MKKKQVHKSGESSKVLIQKVVSIQERLKKLPELPQVEKAKFNQEISINHLYYSSKLEGTQLTEKQIKRAVHGEETLPAR